MDNNSVEPKQVLTSDNLSSFVTEFLRQLDSSGIGIGGGGGGSTSAVPVVTILSETTMIGGTDETFKIDYTWQSANKGNGTVTILADGMEVFSGSMKQGDGTVTVGPFAKGSHQIRITVKDTSGNISIPALVKIDVGSLSLTSDFDDSILYEISDNIKLSYIFEALDYTLDYELERTLDGVPLETEVIQTARGGKEFLWDLGNLTLGVHTVTIKVVRGLQYSNTLRFTIVVGNATSLFLSSEFGLDLDIDEDGYILYELGKTLSIAYRASMKDQSSFKAYTKINDSSWNQANIKSGYNYWNIGELESGDYELRVYATTIDYAENVDDGSGSLTTVGSKSNELVFKVRVIATDFEQVKPVSTGAAFLYKASGMNNNDANRSVWKDDSGKGVVCTLKDFNYSTNGWMTVKRDTFEQSNDINEDLVSILRINAGAYCEIDFTPFTNNVNNGMTFEIFFRVENIGDIEAAVLDAFKHDSPYTGMYINTYQAKFSSNSANMVTPLSENIWTKMTFVVDRNTNMMLIYVNGVIAKVVYLQANESFDANTKKIYIGAKVDEYGNVSGTAQCDIRSVRMYNRTLTSEEIVQNWIADEQNIEKQKALYNKNYDESLLPRLYITAPLDTIAVKSQRMPCDIMFEDPMHPMYNFALTGKTADGSADATTIAWQGTSSLAYNVKNYKIRLRGDNGKKVKVKVRDNWEAETQFTLKAD